MSRVAWSDVAEPTNHQWEWMMGERPMPLRRKVRALAKVALMLLVVVPWSVGYGIVLGVLVAIASTIEQARDILGTQWRVVRFVRDPKAYWARERAKKDRQ